MLEFFKIKKSNSSHESEETAKAVEETEKESNQQEELLPQIKLFISQEQLVSLNNKDEEREHHAMMYLNSKDRPKLDNTIYKAYEERFAKSFACLGNANSKCPHCLREYQSAPLEVKKCLGCSKAFFKTKRPQDGLLVLVKDKDRRLMGLQWENIKKAEMIEGLSQNDLENVRLKLESKNNKKYSLYDTHFILARNYTSKALKSGRFRLYSSLIYYMAEHDRTEKEFTKALSYYFYLYFLQLNGASNSIVFGDKVSVNERIHSRILSLLQMAGLITTECEDLFRYSIEARTAFDFENLPYGLDESYAHLVKAFEKDEGRESY